MEAAAFFDLDNTLLRGASLYFVGRGMHARGIVSTPELLRGAWQQLVFRLAGERAGLVSDVRARSLSFGAGMEVGPFVAMGEEIFDELIADRIVADTVTLARGHLEDGEDVYVVTAAPVELARIVARRLGLTDALGTVSEVAEGRWTGRLVGDFLHGPAKAEAVRRLAAERGYALAACSAYSDSVNDLPLLELVGHPHAVNPERRLRVVAEERGWPVHDFRRGRRAALAVAVGAGVAGGAAAGVVALRASGVRMPWPPSFPGQSRRPG